MDIYDDRLDLHSFPTRRSSDLREAAAVALLVLIGYVITLAPTVTLWDAGEFITAAKVRSEEHTSELQSRRDLVCRLLRDKKNEGPCDQSNLGRHRTRPFDLAAN